MATDYINPTQGSIMFGNYALANHPTLTWKAVEAGITKQYHEPSIAKTLLRSNKVASSAIESLEEGDTQGKVHIISENGDIPRIDTDFLKSVRSVDWYAGYIEVTLDEVYDGNAAAVQTKVENLTYAMQLYEQKAIFYTLANKPGVNTMEGTDWTSTIAGDPLRDIMKAKNKSKKAGIPPDIIAMSTALSDELASFDIIRNRMYNTDGAKGFVNTGELPTVAGLKVVIDDEIDPEDEGIAYVMRTQSIGTWDERHPLRVYSVEGKLLNKDLVAYKTVAMAKGGAHISRPKLITKITGLLGA